MAQKFWLNGYFIDSSRNQISLDGDSQTLPPKTLAVLSYLAEHQGEVVSHDDLMNAVWQDTVVSPNSLQRCITQLRKALGDDSKQQSVIKTHAKQGYSLECQVTWEQPTESQAAPKPSSEQSRYGRFIKPVTILVCCVALFAMVAANSPAPVQPLAFDKLTPVTASDEKEGNVSYSPDGRFIFFHRYLGLCENHIWAKEVATQKEYRLTRQPARYGSHSFSPDGKQLVFLQNRDCEQQIQAKVCWNMVTLDFAKALESPQPTKLLKRCEGPRYNQPRWLNDGSIAMLQKVDDQWQIMRHFTHADSAVSLYAPKDKSLYSLAYSVRQDQMATIGIRLSDGSHVLDIIDSRGQLISSSELKRPDGLSKFRFVYPIFDHKRQQLLFATKKKLFALSYQGDITEIDAPLYANIYNAAFHPNGNRLLATYGTLDNDIAQMALDGSDNPPAKPAFNQVSQPYPSIARSTFIDKEGQFQPKGQTIAFLSERSGSGQIWLTDEQGTRQLTDLAYDSAINGFHWSADGQSVIFAANDQLHQITLNGQVKVLPVKTKVKQLYPSDDSDSVLFKAAKSNREVLLRYHLSSGESTTLVEGNILWAAQNTKDTVYLDSNRTYWRHISAESIKIDGPGGRHGNNRFAMNQDGIYGINKRHELWHFDWHDQSHRTLGKTNKYVSYISDIRDDQLLITQIIAAKKEVIELRVKPATGSD